MVTSVNLENTESASQSANNQTANHTYTSLATKKITIFEKFIKDPTVLKMSASTAIGTTLAVALVLFFASPPGWFVGAGIIGGVSGIVVTICLTFAATFIAKTLKTYLQKEIICSKKPNFSKAFMQKNFKKQQ